MATVSQIEANQRNSMASTGPRTPEGKDVSRRNSFKHGLAGTGGVVAPEDRVKVEARAQAFRDEFRPGSELERTLVEQMAVDSVRMDRCREAYLTLCEDQADRATLCWDEDRRADAEEIAARLAWDPARSRSRLEQSRHGCELMIGRWEGLGRILREVGHWDDSQRSMALNLLGVPLELRAGTTAVDVPGIDPLEARAFRLKVVERELDRLGGRKARAFDMLDEHDRESAEVGIAAELSRPLRLIQRYESACWRRQLAALRILTDPKRTVGPASDRRPEAGPRAASPEPRASSPESRQWALLNDPSWSPRLPEGSEAWTVDEVVDFFCGPEDGPAPPIPPTSAIPTDRRT